MGLIAVNILGDETDAVTASNGKLSSPASDGPGGPDLVYDDLAFQMYVDQDAAKIIRDMETRKAAAVQGESRRKPEDHELATSWPRGATRQGGGSGVRGWGRGRARPRPQLATTPFRALGLACRSEEARAGLSQLQKPSPVLIQRRL